MTRTVSLDRQQREALRHELEVEASAYGDFEYAFKEGDRAYVHRHAERLRRMVAAMDAIGWAEHDEAPDVQAIERSGTVELWARESAAELEDSFKDFTTVSDVDLDAYRALCMIGGE